MIRSGVFLLGKRAVLITENSGLMLHPTGLVSDQPVGWTLVPLAQCRPAVRWQVAGGRWRVDVSGRCGIRAWVAMGSSNANSRAGLLSKDVAGYPQERLAPGITIREHDRASERQL